MFEGAELQAGCRSVPQNTQRLGGQATKGDDMKHTTIYKRNGWYTAFPLLDTLPDGRLAVGLMSSPYQEHYFLGEWRVFVSTDQGASWEESDDPSIPYNWDASSVREKWDRYTEVLPDGSYLAAGSVGWQSWPAEKRQSLEERGLEVHEHPGEAGKIVSGCDRMYVQRSADGGETWDRREYTVQGFGQVHSAPRPIKLADGVILIPVGAHGLDGTWQSFIWRSGDGGSTFRMHRMAEHCGEESAFLEISPGRLLALTRDERVPPHSGHLLEMWSDDAGLTWSHPVASQIWTPNSPPHLLKLRDGRVLCSYGLRRQPMGIRAVLSYDAGQSWDTDNTYVLRDDGGYLSNAPRRPQSRRGLHSPEGDLGYARSTELSDGSILTVYYITLADGVTHAACTRWELGG